MTSYRIPREFVDHPFHYTELGEMSGPAFRAVCRNVVDGDTFDFLVDLGFYAYSYITIRLKDFDAPELFHPKSAAEKELAQRARARVEELLLDKPCVIVTAKDTQTFGRFVADVYYQSVRGVWLSLKATLEVECLSKRDVVG
jgi:endonuclease YncB( thermonuclease family)